MSFLNAILLAGSAAFTIPLIIHLLNRRRVHTISWGAMHLLQQALHLRRRNLNVEQKLLLATRIAIPIILALCLARPVFNLIRQLPGLNKSSLIILLDDSASMRSPGSILSADSSETSHSPREQAISLLQRLLADLPKGSDANVILAGHPPRLLLDQPTTDHAMLLERLNQVPSLAGPVNLSQSLQMAATQLQRSLTAAREILLISDFQQNDWQSLLSGAPLPELESIQQLQPPPSLTFYHLPNQTLDNLTLTQIDTSSFVVAKDQPIALRATIQNHGQKDYQDVPLHLEADGVRIRSTRASIPAGASSTLTLTHTFNTTGDHSITLRLEGDSFPDDNTFSLIVPVREKIPTLLIKGRSGNAAMTGPTDFLEIALSPHLNASNPSTFKDVIQTNVIEENKLRENDLKDQQVIILANIENFTDNQLQLLTEHVEQGSHLIIFPGPDINMNWYDQKFYRNAQGLLPARPTGFGHIDPNQPPARLINQLHTHPATIYFNDARGMNLRDPTFTHWQKLGPLPENARVLLSFENGDPFLIEKPFGKGHVFLFATTATAQWSNLPLQPVFVPLMQRLITHLATKNTPAPHQRTGEEIQYPLNRQQVTQSLQIVDPLNQPHAVTHTPIEPNHDSDQPKKKDNRREEPTETQQHPVATIQYDQTFIPGIYQLRHAETIEATPIKSFAFNPDPNESALETLSAEQIQIISDRLGAHYSSDYPTYQKQDRQRRFGAELWQPVLLLVLLLLFAEVYLQQRIARA